MAITLRRFSAQALPTKATLSPQEAAAGELAPFRFGAEVAETVSEFSQAMIAAEDESIVREQTAQQAATLATFEADPRWQQDTIDGRPTEEVMAEEWMALDTQLQESGGEIQAVAVREKFQTEMQLARTESALRLEDQANRVRIRRTRARVDRTGELLADTGDFETAEETYRAGFAAGLYTADEFNARLKENDRRRRNAPYNAMLNSEDSSAISLTAEQALTDTELTPDEQIRNWQLLSARADSIDAEYNARRAAVQDANAVDMWANFDALDVAGIQASDVPSDQQIAAIKLKRSEARANSGNQTLDDDLSVQMIDGMIASLYSDPNMTVNQVIEAIGNEVDAGSLSNSTALQKINRAFTTMDDKRKGAGVDRIRQTALNLITDGVPVEQLFTFNSSTADQLLALAAEFEADLLDAHMDAGRLFDPQGWYRDNIDEYLSRRDEIAKDEVGTMRTRIISSLATLQGDTKNEEIDRYIIEVERMNADPDEKQDLMRLLNDSREPE